MPVFSPQLFQLDVMKGFMLGVFLGKHIVYYGVVVLFRRAFLICLHFGVCADSNWVCFTSFWEELKCSE